MSATARVAAFGTLVVAASFLVRWLLDGPGAPGLPVGSATLALANPTPTQGASTEACSADAAALTGDQVSSAMRHVLPSMLPCVSASAETPEALLRLRLRVACTGHVESVEPVETGDWSGSVIDCVQDRLANALFPRHGQPEGAVVDLPITLKGWLDAPAPAR